MTSIPSILQPRSDAEILATYEVMRQLRPHLTHQDYVNRIRCLMEQERYRLVALVEDGKVLAVAGYRRMEMLYCGRLLYVDDLVTDEAARSRGYGRQLLGWLKDLAQSEGCAELQLDSATYRESAHRFYQREGLEKTCYHFAARL